MWLQGAQTDGPVKPPDGYTRNNDQQEQEREKKTAR